MIKVGDKAPQFSAQDQNDNMVSLSDFLGRKVILYFYPRDNTPGCTAEACSLRDGYKELIDKGFVVIGVSADSAASHRRFIEKHTLPFTLLVDDHHAIAMSYCTWGEKKFMGRITIGMIRKTFVINEQGVVEKVFDKVDTKNHFQQIVDSYE